METNFYLQFIKYLPSKSDTIIKRSLNDVQIINKKIMDRIKIYIYALLTKREVKMAGYWPSSFFAFLWTETKSRSMKTQKKNEANIQSS